MLIFLQNKKDFRHNPYILSKSHPSFQTAYDKHANMGDKF